MVRLTMLGLLACSLALATACVSESASESTPQEEDDDEIVTSHEALCAGAAPEYEGGYVRASGCAFEQHAENIAAYGEALPDGAHMTDADGVVVGSMQYRCNDWILGQDADGVAIVVDSATGEVKSHGQVHHGNPTSRLPATLELPLGVR